MLPAVITSQLYTSTDRPDYPHEVLSGPGGAFVDAVAWHCYADANRWSVLSDFHAAHPQIEQHMTECWLHAQDEGFFELSDFVLGPLQNWASSALAWTVIGMRMRAHVAVVVILNSAELVQRTG